MKRRADPQWLADNRGHLAFLLAEFTVPHLLGVHKMFKGDIALAIVLGEIAQHNVRRFFLDPKFKPGTGAEMVLRTRLLRHPMLSGCNALSISRSTGLPRETVRRKVVTLLRRGWIYRDERRSLYVAPDIIELFAESNEASLAAFLDVAADIRRVLDARSDSSGATTTGDGLTAVS